MEKPRNRGTVQQLISNLQDFLGSTPFHLQTVLVKDGLPSLLGLAAGLWEKTRSKSVAPFVADVAPTPADTGIVLFDSPQAMIYFDYPGGNGLETMTFTVWHRRHSYSNTDTVGQWTKGQTYADLVALQEELDPYLWHSELYIQCTAVNLHASGATSVSIFVTGVQDVTSGAQLDVHVPPISVDVDAFGTPGDSTMAVGSEDGTPTGTRHVLRMDNTGVATVRLADSQRQLVVGSGGIFALTGTAHNAACRVGLITVSETGGVNPVTVTIKDGGVGGTQKIPTILVPAGTSKEIEVDVTFGTDVYATVAGLGTAEVAVYIHQDTVTASLTLGSAGVVAGSGIIHNAPARVGFLVISETVGTNPVTAVLKDNAGATVKTVTHVCPAGQTKVIPLDLAFVANVTLTKGGAGTMSAAVYVY